jgi:hypothetical protein
MGFVALFVGEHCLDHEGQITGVNRVPEQQHSSDHATEERRLEAVRCNGLFGISPAAPGENVNYAESTLAGR